MEIPIPLDQVAAEFKAHALEACTPIQASIEMLKALGATVDFEHDLAVFTKINPKDVITLERAP